MSQMKELYAKVAKDPSLQQEFAEIMKGVEKASAEDTEKKLAGFAKAAGYDVSIEEFKTFTTDLIEKQKNGELSDTELDLVAGGKSTEGIINIVNTVVNLGIGCAIMSAIYAIGEGGRDCADMYN